MPAIAEKRAHNWLADSLKRGVHGRTLLNPEYDEDPHYLKQGAI
jgi:hypothetical protein